MAKSTKTVEIVGKAGTLTCNDTEDQRRLWHKRGYKLKCGSPLIEGTAPAPAPAPLLGTPATGNASAKA